MATTKKCKGCSLLPPNPQPYPWFMISHGKSGSKSPALRVSSFYNISENCGYITKIPDFSDKRVCTSCQEWLVMMHHDTCECFLLNIVSLEKIKLPQGLEVADEDDEIEWDFEDESDYECKYNTCVLTAPPTDSSNCMVGFFVNNRGRARIWRPGQEDWVEQSQGLDEFRNATVCNGKIYGFVSDDWDLAICEMVDGKLEVRKLGMELNNPPGVVNASSYFLESCGNIYLINVSMLGETTYRIRYVDVYQVDNTHSKLIKVNNIGDRVFFLNVNGESISCATTNLGIRGNCIYFTNNKKDWTLVDYGLKGNKDRSLYTFDMEANRIHASLPCPNAVHNRSLPHFIMVQP